MKFIEILYWIGTCIVASVNNFDMELCLIDNCSVVNGQPYLICRKLRTRGFERHYHAFRITETDEYNLVKISDLKDQNVLGIYPHPNHLCDILVVPKYKVLC